MRRVVWVVAVVLLVLLVTAVTAAILRPSIGRSIWSLLHAYRWWVLAMVVALAVVLLGRLLGALMRLPSSSPWRAHVLAAANAIQHHFCALMAADASANSGLSRSVGQAVRHHLDIAMEAARLGNGQKPSLGQQFVDWWTGTSVEAAFLNLHQAEIAVTQLFPPEEIEARIPEVLARLQTMDATDPRRRAAERDLDLNRPLSWPRRRAAFQNAVRIGFELKDQQYARLRSFRNIVLAATLGLTVLVIGICLVGARDPDAIPLCFGPPPTTAATGAAPAPVQGPAGVACPSEEAPPTPGRQSRRLPAPGDVALVALVGLLGGGLSAAVAIRRLQGTSTPYSIPVTLSLLKLPAGAVSAVVGILLVQGSFVPGLSQLDNQPQILAYAFLFGIAQQLVTRLVDQQAQDILGKVPSKEPTSAKPQPPPTEHQIQRRDQPEQLTSPRRRLSRRNETRRATD